MKPVMANTQLSIHVICNRGWWEFTPSSNCFVNILTQKLNTLWPNDLSPLLRNKLVRNSMPLTWLCLQHEDISSRESLLLMELAGYISRQLTFAKWWACIHTIGYVYASSIYTSNANRNYVSSSFIRTFEATVSDFNIHIWQGTIGNDLGNV